MTQSAMVAEVVARMQDRLDRLPADQQHRAAFLGTYLRTTVAVGKAVDDGGVRGPGLGGALGRGVRRAVPAGARRRPGRRWVPRPWRLAFDAPAELPALRHVLLGINAHVNYDLPQAMLAVISPDDFTDPVLLGRRQRDHERIDKVLAGRVAAEDDQLSAEQTLLDRLLRPLNRLASKRFLREARQKVWHNVGELHAARLIGPDSLPDAARRARGAQRGPDR